MPIIIKEERWGRGDKNTHMEGGEESPTVTLATHLMGLIIQHDKVSVTDIETREVLTGILGIKNILVNDKCCALCVGCIAPGIKRSKYNNN